MYDENKKVDEKHHNDKSLFIYTALIFMVAILMIVIAFFAQMHLEKSRVNEADKEKVGLSQKAAQVSEENMQLVELNKNLKEANSALTDEKTTLVADRDTLKKEVDGYKALIAVYDKLYTGDKAGAVADLQNIYTEDLSSDQKNFYDILVKKSQ